MNWDGSILTDSGGFQVFSLSDLRKIEEEGSTLEIISVVRNSSYPLKKRCRFRTHLGRIL